MGIFIRLEWCCCDRKNVCANLFLQPSFAGMAELADAADSKTDLEFTRQIAPGRIYPQIQGITSPRMPVSSVPNRAESR